MNKYNSYILDVRGPVIQVSLQFLMEHKMTFNEYIVCYLIADDNRDLLKLYNQQVENIEDSIKSCVKKGFLDGYQKDIDNLTITQNVRFLYLNSSVGSWIDKWFDLWPSGVKSSGYYVKTDKVGCIKKLERFRRKYPHYSPLLILEATENYVNRMKIHNYSYMRLAPYFIEKDGISSLAGECEQLLEQTEADTKPKEDKFGERLL